MESIHLIQRSFPLKKLHLSVESNRELVVEHSTLFRSIKQTFPLDLVDPSPIHYRSIPVRWVVTTTVFLVLAVSALIGGWANQGLGEQFGLLFLSGIFLACLCNTLKLSSNMLHYRNANTDTVLFSMFRRKPSRSEVDAFAEVLRERIESLRTPSGLSNEELIDLYKRHLDYLLENEILLQVEYDTILLRLQERASKMRVIELVH